MKIKNKLFLVLFVFMFFIFISNYSYAFELPEVANETNVITNDVFIHYKYFLSSVSNAPDIYYFKNFDILSNFEIGKLYVFEIGRSGIYFTLNYYNKETKQAIFNYGIMNGTSVYDYSLKKYDYNATKDNGTYFYFLDNNSGNNDLFGFYYGLQEISISDSSNYFRGIFPYNKTMSSFILNFDQENFINKITFIQGNNSRLLFDNNDSNKFCFYSTTNDSNILIYDVDKSNFTINSSLTDFQTINDTLCSPWYNLNDCNVFIYAPYVNYVNVKLYQNNMITIEQLEELNFYKVFTNSPFDYDINSINTDDIISVNKIGKSSSGTSSIIENVNLYIDDFNLKKRFKFDLKIPFRDINTKYYLFLNSYERKDYDNVTIDLKVITIDLPEGFDTSSYFNYMYYDNILKKCLAPAGATIKEYSCVVNSGSVGTCDLLEERIGTRNSLEYNGVSMTDLILKGFLEPGTNETYNIDTLFNTNTMTSNNYLTNIFQFVLESYLFITGDKFVVDSFLSLFDFDNVGDFIYKYMLEVFYYDNTPIANYDDFIGGNYYISSYENARNSWNKKSFYNLFRKTFVYSQENYIDSISLAFNYIDNEDVSDLLPEEDNKTYLTSPFYKENENSSSGGYIVYNITNVFDGNDTIINYGQDESPIREDMGNKYYTNFIPSNNIPLTNSDNNDIHKVELSANDKWILDEIYNLLVKIEYNSRKFTKKYVTNAGDTVTNTLYNAITEAIVPDEMTLDEVFNDIQYIIKNSLGFLYDPFIFIEFLFQEIDDLSNDEIIFHSPSISIMGFQVLPEMQFDFNKQLFDTTDEWKFIRTVQLTVCNFVLVCMFINYFITAFNRIFGVPFQELDVDNKKGG